MSNKFWNWFYRNDDRCDTVTMKSVVCYNCKYSKNIEDYKFCTDCGVKTNIVHIDSLKKLPNDVLAKVLSYVKMGPSIVYDLYSSTDNYDAVLQKLLKMNFETLMKRKNVKFDLKLHEFGVFLSGSTMIQCMLNVNWVSSDLDIFCFEDKKYAEYLNNLGFTKIEQENFRNVIYRKLKNVNRISRFCLNENQANEIRIDLIVFDCKDEGIYESISNNFDINICRSFYDGKRFHIVDPKLSFNKCSKFNIKTIPFKTKNSNEGFEYFFTILDSVAETRKAYQRCLKYRDRGIFVMPSFY